jgi:hypothetical protein
MAPRTLMRPPARIVRFNRRDCFALQSTICMAGQVTTILTALAVTITRWQCGRRTMDGSAE